MKTLLDSIVLNRIQFESTSNYVQLFVNESTGDMEYEAQYFFSMDQFNLILNELAAREIELNFDAMDSIILPGNEEINYMDLSANPIILPAYCMPKQSLAMIA